MSEYNHTGILLEEYKALRQESLRSSAILSNTVWISISGFIITVGAFANAAKGFPAIVEYLPLLLCVQAFSATSMFLSETWKYARVGVYIREKIEKSLLQEENNENLRENPLYWEHWITNRRALVYYYSVLGLLQLPIVITILILSSSLFGWNFSSQISSIGSGVSADAFKLVSTMTIVAIDIGVTIFLIVKIFKIKNVTILIDREDHTNGC